LQCATDDVQPPVGVATAIVARHRRRLRNVSVKTGITDLEGRPAIEISHRNSSTGVTSTTFENPSTGTVLEQDFSDVGPALYGTVTGSATLPRNPYSGT
jgi:hypothetical protein